MPVQQSTIVRGLRRRRKRSLAEKPPRMLRVLAAFAVCMSPYEFLIRRYAGLRFLFGMGPKRPRPAATPAG